MKKITYTLNFGLIGLNNSANEFKSKIFLEYLKDLTIKSNVGEDKKNREDINEFLILFKDVPIKLRIFIAENFNEIIYNYENIKILDVIILILRCSDKNSIHSFSKDSFEEFKDYISFRNGISVLTGITLNGDIISDNSRINHSQLIEKAKELNVLYGYEISDDKKEISEFFNRILNDFIFKFQNSSPELFDLAKMYGKELRGKS